MAGRRCSDGHEIRHANDGTGKERFDRESIGVHPLLDLRLAANDVAHPHPFGGRAQVSEYRVSTVGAGRLARAQTLVLTYPADGAVELVERPRVFLAGD